MDPCGLFWTVLYTVGSVLNSLKDFLTQVRFWVTVIRIKGPRCLELKWIKIEMRKSMKMITVKCTAMIVSHGIPSDCTADCAFVHAVASQP